MTGTYEHIIDAKGRMFLPAKLRYELGATFHIAVGANRDAAGVCKYLVMYPEATWQKLKDRVAELPSSQAAAMYRQPPPRPKSASTSRAGFRLFPEQLEMMAAGRVMRMTILERVPKASGPKNSFFRRNQPSTMMPT